MKFRQSAVLLLAGASLSSLSACSVLENSLQNTRFDIASASTPSPSPQPEDRPATRIMAIRVDGRMSEVELKLLNQSKLPFTTYYPAKDFKPQALQSDGGDGIRLVYSPKGKPRSNTYVDLVQPNQEATLDQLRDYILDPQGLLAKNQWQLIDRTDVVSYPWVKEKLIYQQQTQNGTIEGAIYVGEEQGQAFYLITHYPAEEVNRFESLATIALENVQFRTEE
ncbi:hypothetical protein [Leptolyngbya ohadii]|uniref:hypothetical protein n=1 Tax=Leptolyngbya ohadii TaxID=1962290 RepID=UPI000B59E154|nr:hypothetical protein [Leptolyngbya ohadii]